MYQFEIIYGLSSPYESGLLFVETELIRDRKNQMMKGMFSGHEPMGPQTCIYGADHDG